MHSSAFPAQLEITCSPRGCHLESGKPIYFPPPIGVVVLVRCRKPINHQRSLRVSLSEEACHLPGLEPHESCQREGRGGGGARRDRGHLQGRGPGAPQMFAAPSGRGQAGTSSPPAPACPSFDVGGSGSGWGGQASSLGGGGLVITSHPRCSFSGRNGS